MYNFTIENFPYLDLMSVHTYTVFVHLLFCALFMYIFGVLNLNILSAENVYIRIVKKPFRHSILFFLYPATKVWRGIMLYPSVSVRPSVRPHHFRSIT